MAEVADWVVTEMTGVDFNDKRLNKRALTILSDLSANPTLSIPAACTGSAETTATYRFIDNQKTTFDKVIAPHRRATIARAQAQDVVVVVPDTTEIDVTRPNTQVQGAGPLDDSTRLGFFLHTMQAFTIEGTPLGEVWSKIWARDAEPSDLDQKAKEKLRKTTPIAQKESCRWLEALREAREFAKQCPKTKCVFVADSEADIYELFVEDRGEINPIEWVIRLCQDRALVQDTADEDETGRMAQHVRERLRATNVLYQKEIHIRGREAKVACETRGRRQPRKSRTAKVEVRAATMTLRPPWRPDGKLSEVTVNVVLVREVDPPADDVAVEWLLITTLPIGTLKEVQALVQFYVVRWMIEIVFRTLKSGCRVEERRFESGERVLVSLGLYLVVTWRTLFVCRMGRNCPEMDCEALFEPSEWKSVWLAVKKKPLPEKPPSLGEMVRLVAQLGGYVNRPNREDEPGAQTVWVGMQRMHDLAWAWEVFGPDASKATG